MADASRRAAAKPARGGVENALFLQGALETLPADLDGLATALTVNYPWGSLLRAVALPDPRLLFNLARLAQTGAALDILINMQPLRDAAYASRLGLANAAIIGDHACLRAAYAEAGFAICCIEVAKGPVHATRWGNQLHHAGRAVAHIRAIRTP
jgi:16S rRNA (adenine(1408)-N(1))-methyltransferase